MKKALCLLISLVILLTGLSSCKKGGKDPETDNIDDSVSIKLPVSFVDSFDPYLCETSFNSQITLLLYDGLIKIEDDLTYKNALASGINVGKGEISVTVRNDAYFSDGTRVTARDVTASFEKAKDSELYSSRLSNFESAVSSGDNVVVFKTVREDVYCVNCLDFPILKFETKKAESEDGADTVEAVGDELGNIIGSGRYKFDSTVADTLTLNEYWYGEELPKIRRIKLVNLIDAGDAVDSMETGNVSFLFQDLSSGVFNRVNAQTSEILMTNLVFLGINAFSKCLTKPEVRQAINLVISKDSIAENAFLGYAKAAKTPFYPSWNKLAEIYFDETDEKEDLYEANRLLDSAGYAETNEIGMRSSSDTTLKLLVNSDNPYKSAAADEIAKSLKSIGLSVSVNKVDFETYKNELANVSYDLYIGEVKLPDDMSLEVFFGEDAGAAYGINKDTDIVEEYYNFRAGKVSLQRFADLFNVYLPFIPLCYRKGIASYTNELSYENEGTHSDVYAGIYTWKY